MMADRVAAALADRRRAGPHPPRRRPRRARRRRRTVRSRPPLALPGPRPRRPSGVGDDAHRPPRPRTVAVLVRRPPRRRHRPRRASAAAATRVDAVDWLAARAGMIPDRPLPPIPAKPRPAPPATTMDPAVERYVRICAAVLWGPQGAAGARLVARPRVRRRDDAGQPARLRPRPPTAAPPTRPPLRQGAGGDVPGARHRPGRSRSSRPATSTSTPPAASTTTRPPPSPPTRASPSPVTPGSPRWPLLMVCEGMPDALTAAQAGYRSVGLLGAQAPDALRRRPRRQLRRPPPASTSC